MSDRTAEGVNIRVYYKDGKTETRPADRMKILDSGGLSHFVGDDDEGRPDFYADIIKSVGDTKKDVFLIPDSEIKAIQVFFGRFTEKEIIRE